MRALRVTEPAPVGGVPGKRSCCDCWGAQRWGSRGCWGCVSEQLLAVSSHSEFAFRRPPTHRVPPAVLFCIFPQAR